MTSLKQKRVLASADRLAGIPDAQMEQIIKGIRQRVPVEEYVNKGYSAAQMKEIRLGMVKGVSYELYAAPYISPRAMHEWRKALEKGVSDKTIIEYLCIDGKNYTANQIKEIRLGLQDKQDVKLYANPDFTSEQMKEIRLGQKAGVNAELYADLSFSSAQMKKLRIELVVAQIIDYIKSMFKNVYQNICIGINKLAQENGEVVEMMSTEDKANEYIRRAYERIAEDNPDIEESPLDKKVNEVLSYVNSRNFEWADSMASSEAEAEDMEM
ncbi:MAG: hypothetical protein J6D27_00360 [Ruminiclostridium sp.]|nr:hypothetical protein [Ruminiclostridium sp.]